MVAGVVLVRVAVAVVGGGNKTRTLAVGRRTEYPTSSPNKTQPN